MNTILIPIDFSSGSLMIARFALELIKDQETLIHLFHIYPDQLMIPDSSFIDGMDSDAFLSTELMMELQKQSVQNMNNFEKEVQQLIKESGKKNISTTNTVTGGDPELEIMDICQTAQPDLIVMGTRGEGNKGFLEGSMASKIMSTVNIPVIAVPDTIENIAIRNVMYATNFSNKDLEHIKKLTEIFSSAAFVFHVVHFELNGRSIEDTSMMEVLQSAVHQEFSGIDIRFHLLESENKSESLQSFVQNNSIDLIAFIAHKTNIFKNLFSSKIHKKDFFKLELPMLALYE